MTGCGLNRVSDATKGEAISSDVTRRRGRKLAIAARRAGKQSQIEGYVDISRLTALPATHQACYYITTRTQKRPGSLSRRYYRRNAAKLLALASAGTSP